MFPIKNVETRICCMFGIETDQLIYYFQSIPDTFYRSVALRGLIYHFNNVDFNKLFSSENEETETETETNKTKVSDSGYSNSCSNSQSQRR